MSRPTKGHVTIESVEDEGEMPARNTFSQPYDNVIEMVDTAPLDDYAPSDWMTWQEVDSIEESGREERMMSSDDDRKNAAQTARIIDDDIQSRNL